MEAYDILKQVLDILPYFNHLHLQFVQYLPKSIGATDIPSLIPGNIEAELDAELALLKAKPGAAGEQKRDLQSCLTNTKGLIFIAMVEGLDPVEIVHRLLSEVLLTKDFKGRFCQRLTPITHTCSATLEAIRVLHVPPPVISPKHTHNSLLLSPLLHPLSAHR